MSSVASFIALLIVALIPIALIIVVAVYVYKIIKMFIENEERKRNYYNNVSKVVFEQQQLQEEWRQLTYQQMQYLKQQIQNSSNSVNTP